MRNIVLPSDPLIDGPTLLRPWRDSDAAAVTAACRDPDIARWTRVPDNYTQADARAFLLYRDDAVLAGVAAPFAVVSPDARLLGSVALIEIDWPHLRSAVGYWLAREARGEGHATRAVRLICGWGFDVLGLERIVLHAATENAASQGVAERSGFTREAVLRDYIRGKLGQEDMVTFGLLSDEHGDGPKPRSG